MPNDISLHMKTDIKKHRGIDNISLKSEVNTRFVVTSLCNTCIIVHVDSKKLSMDDTHAAFDSRIEKKKSYFSRIHKTLKISIKANNMISFQKS